MVRSVYYFCKQCNIYLPDSEIENHLKDYPGHILEEVFTDKQRVRLSKLLSFLLRHNPESLDLKLENNGFTTITIDELIKRIKYRHNYDWVNKRTIEALVFLDKKGRFEIINNRIRARYGHSIKNIKIDYNNGNIPDFLYHGTSKDAYLRIKNEGLKAKNRNLVHLTSSIKDALEVGYRHSKHSHRPIILRINVKKALDSGIKIWKAGKNVYVSKFIPPKFIELKTKKNEKN